MTIGWTCWLILTDNVNLCTNDSAFDFFKIITHGSSFFLVKFRIDLCLISINSETFSNPKVICINSLLYLIDINWRIGTLCLVAWVCVSVSGEEGLFRFVLSASAFGFGRYSNLGLDAQPYPTIVKHYAEGREITTNQSGRLGSHHRHNKQIRSNLKVHIIDCL